MNGYTEEWLLAYNARRKGSRTSESAQAVKAQRGLKAPQESISERLRGIRIDTGKRPKFGNRKTEVDGIVFDSQKEALKYAELRIRERAGEISNLTLQVKFSLDVNGEHICNYIADFCYDDEAGNVIVEDCKGVRTKDYRLKAKLMKAIYGIVILET